MFEFTSSIFFWTLINFVVLLFLIHKYALPPFYRILEEREQKRLSLMDELEKNTTHSKQIMDEYQQKLTAIEDEAKSIIKEAHAEKETIKKEVFASALIEKQKILTSIKDELEIEKKQFIEEMKISASDLVIECTEKIMQKELNAADHMNLIQKNISELDNLLRV